MAMLIAAGRISCASCNRLGPKSTLKRVAPVADQAVIAIENTRLFDAEQAGKHAQYCRTILSQTDRAGRNLRRPSRDCDRKRENASARRAARRSAARII